MGVIGSVGWSFFISHLFKRSCNLSTSDPGLVRFQFNLYQGYSVTRCTREGEFIGQKKKFDVPLISFQKSLRGTPLSDNL